MQPNNVITINKTVLTNNCTRGLQTILTAKLFHRFENCTNQPIFHGFYHLENYIRKRAASVALRENIFSPSYKI